MGATLFRAGIIARADAKTLANAAGIPYSTLKSAIQSGRFSATVEDLLAKLAGFRCDDPCWVDEAKSEAERRSTQPGYAGRDTVEGFRAQLDAAHTRAGSFRSSQRGYSALDPHMARHELSDSGQATPSGADMQFVLAAHFEPFYHPSGIMFGFRKAAISVDIAGPTGPRAVRRLGYPEAVPVRDAILSGDGLAMRPRWSLEIFSCEGSILRGEYATTNEPLLALAGAESGTIVNSRIEVNLFDRTTCGDDNVMPELSGNKQALIEHIFSAELPNAHARNGWIVLSAQESVIARFRPCGM